MIDNGQALLLPISIFAIIFIYYLFRKFTKPKKNTVSNDKKTETETDLKYMEHTATGKFYIFVYYIFMFFAVLFFSSYILNKIFPENEFFKEILEGFNQDKKTNNLGIDTESEEFKNLLIQLQDKNSQDKKTNNLNIDKYSEEIKNLLIKSQDKKNENKKEANDSE